MKAIIPVILFTFSSVYSTAQLTEQDLDYNNAGTTLSNRGTFFNGGQAGAGYEIPKGGGVDVIYSSQFWFGARDVNGMLYTVLGGIDESSTDIDQGPYSSNNSYIDSDYGRPYMVSLCQEEIDAYKLWWECSNGVTTTGCADAVQPSNFLLSRMNDWPANGNPSLGQAAQLAPFFDRDGDGVYDPVGSGDYPLIKGCCATYMIQNDQGNIHASGTDPMGIEMHYLFYQFGANTDLYNTTFVDVMVINRGTVNYPEFAMSFMADADLGNASDDYFGSDSTTNTMIFYNSDNMDEGGYLENPPAIGVTALELPSTSIMSYGFVPSTASQAWSLFNGLQPNGAPIIDPDGNPTTFLAYGDPNDPTQWNETSAGYITGDRRGLNTTKIESFNSGDTLLQSYAIVYSEGGNHLENASNVINLASWAKTFYDTEIDNGCEAGGIASAPELENIEISIYPNPNNGTFTIESPNAQVRSIQIFDVTGKEIGFLREGSQIMDITLLDAASGVYLINVQTETGLTVERLVVE